MSANTLKITTVSDREIVITRVFNAPRRLVFDAHTKPELVRQWLGAFTGWTMPVCEIDLRVGGRYRYLWKKDGEEMGMGGEFREIVKPERLVATEVFDDPWYPGAAVDTSVFVEQNGRTTLTLTVQYESRAARDAVLQSPMETGLKASYDRLEELLPAFAQTAVSP
jgi:uncharacterized protein YndB with AHSA1/START domain